MDRSLRWNERASRLSPGDAEAVLSQARRLARAALWEEARELLHTRLGAGYLDTDTLQAMRDVGAGAHSLLASTPPTTGRPPLRSHVDQVVAGRSREPGVELRPTLALAGPRHTEPWRLARTLWRAFRTAASRHARSYQAYGERGVEMEIELRTPWQVAPGHRIARLRVITLPATPRASKLRRRLLRPVSGVALLSPGPPDLVASQELPTMVKRLEELSHDFRRVHGHALERTPLLLHYGSPIEPCRHEELTRSLGLGSLGCVAGGPPHDPLASRITLTLAVLLLDVARGIGEGLARPRT